MPNKAATARGKTMETIDISVTPNIGVEITTSKNAEYQPFDQTNEVLLEAINKVRAMPADKLKKLVIDGLVDADMYPRDFAEF